MIHRPLVSKTFWMWTVIALLLLGALGFAFVAFRQSGREYAAAERLVGEGHKLLLEIDRRRAENPALTALDVALIASVSSNRLASYPIVFFPAAPEVLTFRVNRSFGITLNLRGGVELVKFEEELNRRAP